MKYLFVFISLLINVTIVRAQATDLVVDCQTPGWLSNKINYGDQQTVKNLKVTGYINATDLRFIGSMTQMSLTGIIDLADATIVGGEWNGAFKSLPNSWSSDYDYHLQKLILPKTLTRYIEHEGTFKTEIDTMVFDTRITKLEGYDSAHRNYRTDTERTLKRKIGHLIIGESVDSIINVGNAKTVQFPQSLKYLENYSCNGRTDFSRWNISTFPNLEYLGFCAFTYDSPGNGQSGFSNNQTLPDSIFLPNIRYYCMSSFDYKKGMHIFFGDKLEDIFESDGVAWSYSFHSTIENVSFHFKTMIPPSAATYYCSPSCIIYVPKGAKQAYIDSGQFSKFTIIEEKQPLLDITIDRHEMRMEVGETVQLSASPIPDNADDPTIIWSSDNDSVVSVTQNGIVTAKVAGYTNIIAMSADKLIRDTCRVTVNAHAESVSLSSSSIVLTEIGETYQLEASIIPDNAVNKSITWKSLNEAVCYVSANGLVIAVDYGTAVVTATTVDGGHTATCTVKVVHVVETVEMETHELTMKAKDTTQLKVKVLPDNAYDKKVIWTSSNNSLATVDADGNVKALAVGEVFIKATSSVNAEAADSCLVTIMKRIEVTDSTIVWNDTTFIYSGLSPQPSWKNTQSEYTVTAEMPELEKNVGRWETIVPFSFTDSVDTLTIDVPLHYAIKPAPLTIIVNDTVRYYGEENPEFTFTYEGFVNDETEEVLTQKPVATTAATVESPTGTYPITVEGAEADNYTIEYVDGILAIIENIDEEDDNVTDVVTANDVTLKAGENATLTVSLTTTDTDYNGYQFNLYLPEGITVAIDENGNYLVTEKTGREMLALGVSDGSVLFYTTADKNHDALVSGPLVDIELTADSILAAGNYTIRIERVVCATRENKSVSLPSSTATITVQQAGTETQGVITADDVEGEPAKQIKLPIFLNNTTDINAFYFDLTLPMGVTVAKDNEGQFVASFVGDYADGQMLLSCQPWDASMGTTNNVNTWRFIATPKGDDVFRANAGRVMNITLDVDKDMAGGVYTARMNVVKLIEVGAVGSRADSGQCFQVLRYPAVASWTSYSSITIKTAMQGDVNGDGVVDVADIAAIIDTMAANTRRVNNR